MKIKGAEDLISNLPDGILQHMLCLIPIKLAMSTSLLSRRWRHVWCEKPSITLGGDTLTAASINETLARYTAPKKKSFDLLITPITKEKIPYLDRWIKFATSHNVENLSLNFSHYYKLPDFFYNSSYFKQLNIYSHTIVPFKCTVSWTSLHKLSLSCCSLSDKSMAKILSGCPVLENLTLYHCGKLKVIDLTKSLRLKTLVVDRNVMVPEGPTKIVAPHIHYLRLLDSRPSCTLVDVASLTEAKLDVCYALSTSYFKSKADFLQDMVLKMLEKLQNAEKLTFGGNFVKILSLVEIRGVSFPMLKVKSLILDTVIYQYVIPGIQRLLQNSPDLEKLIVRGRTCSTIPEEHLDQYLKSLSLNPDQWWRSKDGFSLNNSCWNLQSKKLDKRVVLSGERYLKFNFKEHSLP
ncbi:unnamed protein product [Brassica napus]|nr:unnamed protein product [Brassica napus]